MTTPDFDAWHLPGMSVDEVETLEAGDLVCRYPVPTAELLASTVGRLREAGRALAERPVASIVDVVDTVAQRLSDAGDPLYEEAERLVAAATGYSAAMTRLVLDRMTADWRADRLWELLEAELPDPTVLDGFRPVGEDRRARAYGPELAFHAFAGNVPGVAVSSLVRTLLVKTPSLGKLASRQPVLPVLFARAVHAVDAEVGRALAVTYWPGGSHASGWQVLEAADTVIVYGGDEAVAAYRERTPATTRLVVHGPRFSVGLIARQALAGDPTTVAREVAGAVAAFDQHGCVSPHAVWVEETQAVTAVDFAEALAAALADVEEALPRGRLSPGEASAIQQERATAELKGHAPGRSETRVLSGPGTRWTVIYDAEPAFHPSCLNRLVRVHPVGELDEVIGLLAPVGRLLQSVAVAGPDRLRVRLAHRLARIGATRVTTFPRLPWPRPDWHHDGREPVRELLHWVDIETG